MPTEPEVKEVRSVDLLPVLHRRLVPGDRVNMQGAVWWAYGVNRVAFRVGRNRYHVGPGTPDLTFGFGTIVELRPQQEPFGRHLVRDVASLQDFVLECLRVAKDLDNPLRGNGDKDCIIRMRAWVEKQNLSKRKHTRTESDATLENNLGTQGNTPTQDNECQL